MTENASHYQARLSADFPDLTIEKVEALAQGWDHTALQVNGAIVFRIPRGVYNSDKLAHSVGHETAVLQRLQGKLPVDIPNPLYIAPGNAYFGYPKLPGSLLIDLYPQFTAADKTALLEQWVAIASAIHRTITVDEANELHVPEFDVSTADTERIFELPDLEPAVLAFASKTIQQVKSTDIHYKPLTLIHNDLQFYNLLADPATRRITGVIDWTDACIGPLAREFSLHEWLHDDSLERAANLYKQKTGIEVDIAQARMWKHVEELDDLVMQTESGEQAGAAQSLDHIRQWIKEGR